MMTSNQINWLEAEGIVPGDPEIKESIPEKDNSSEKAVNTDSKSKQADIPKRAACRRSKTFQPIILCWTLFFLMLSGGLFAQFSGSVNVGMTYTDNAFQLSDYDLQRNEDGYPDMDFINSSDDLIFNTRILAAFNTHWRWWKIQPVVQFTGTQFISNTSKQQTNLLTGIKVSRRIGELALYYGYYPDIYIRNYIDKDGTGVSERFSYDRNHYRADLKANLFRNSVASIGFRLDEYYYNEFFTEFDGDITTWNLGLRQSFPTFYLDGSYGYRVYETSGSADIPEDASYESNVYQFGLLLKRMPLDYKYPEVEWRPELNLRFEERFFQGGDSWYAGRADKIYNTTGALHFYLGDQWNLKLDYSHIFRNVDAVNPSVRKYKEYSENRFGLTAGYRF